MAKAKKPASKGSPATDAASDTKSTGSTTPTSTGSVPKTTRSKSTGPSPAAVKASAAELASGKPAAAAATATSTGIAASKTPESIPAKPDVKSEAAKPSETKPQEKSEPAKAEAPDPGKADPKKVEPTPARPAPVPVAPQQAAPAESGSVFWPLLFGGGLAMVLGFFAAEMNLFGTRGDLGELRSSLQRQQAQITDLKNAETPAPVAEFPELDAMTAELAALTQTVSGIEARLTEVEKRPMTDGTSDAAVAAYERELAALQASVEAQRSEIEGLLDNALSVEEATAAAARRATLQAALTRITTAVNAGKPFGSALADLNANGLKDMPVALTDTAESGVVTLINLQTRFPGAARAALAAARAAGTDETEGGVGGFLRRQLGARSVAPREGTDPDAVLSRAEAAVRDGRLTDALAEIDTLPETAQGAMEEWLTDARARQAVEAATEEISQRLTAN